MPLSGALSPITSLVDDAGQPADAAVELLGSRLVGLYFSAHWCPPCRRFAPLLSEFAKTHSDEFSVVYVSSDRSERQFEENLEGKGFLAVPYDDDDVREALQRQHEISGIPSLVIVDGKTGEIVSKRGREELTRDAGKALAKWKAGPAPKAPSAGLPGALAPLAAIVDDAGNAVPGELVQAMRTKFVGLYFSAKWCPPCRAFAPKLSAFLKSNPNDFSVVYVSSDSDENEMALNIQGKGFWAVPYQDDEVKAALSMAHSVRSIPTLIVVDGATGEIVSKKGRADVELRGQAALEKWRNAKAGAGILPGALSPLKGLVDDSGAQLPEEVLKSLQGKVVGLYFSAKWCGPCRQFSPRLAEFLAARKDNFAVVYVSADRSEEDMVVNIGGKGYLAVPFDDQETRAALTENHDVTGIPTLVIVRGSDGNVISTEGRRAIVEGADRAWKDWQQSGRL